MKVTKKFHELTEAFNQEIQFIESEIQKNVDDSLSMLSDSYFKSGFQDLDDLNSNDPVNQLQH